MRKAQTSVEFIIILAVALVILLVILGISTQQMKSISVSKSKSDAQASVSELAAAVDSVYKQGEGARKQVFVTIPSGVDPARTYISNQSININVLGSDVFATTQAEVRGTLPTAPGGYWLWVVAKSGRVEIGALALSIEPGTVSVSVFSSNTSQFAQRALNVSNLGTTPFDVELTLVWAPTNVTVILASAGDATFSLGAGESRIVSLNTTISASALGTYTGYIYADASNGDSQTVDIVVDVGTQACGDCPSCPGCPPCFGNCTPSYFIIETFADSSYATPKEVFSTSETVKITGGAWAPNSFITLNITGPGGLASGYPKAIPTNSSGEFEEEWNPAGASSGAYVVSANQSAMTKSYNFNINACTT